MAVNRRSELEHLLDLTVLAPTHPQLGTCWQFTGTCTPYGCIAKAQDSYAHRLGWKLLRGPIPEGKELHHRCGVYACWNPDHLEPVTHAQNQSHLRKTHCKHGHLLSGDNLRIGPNGVRACRACNAGGPAGVPRAPTRRWNPSRQSPIGFVMLTSPLRTAELHVSEVSCSVHRPGVALVRL